MSAGVCTQAQFAAAQGWHRSTVTRLKQAGRLVMQGSRVDVAASLARIEETGGMRFDVAERHAANRTQPQAQRDGQKTAAAPPAGVGEGEGQGSVPNTAPVPDAVTGERRSDAQARKEAALADKAEMEVQQMRGNLIPREDVDAALRAFGASVRAKLDVLPDQIAPLVAPVTDMDEVHALLAEHARGILSAVADEMSRAAQAAGQGAA
jgi:hypothetical protein